MAKSPTLYVVRYVTRSGQRDEWQTLAEHKGQAFAWLLMLKPDVMPETIEVQPYGT